MRKSSNNLKSILAIILFLSLFGVLVLNSGNNSEQNNNNNNYVIDVTEDVYFNEMSNKSKKLKLILRCIDRPFKLEKIQDGSFWILKNYIRADHAELNCAESITYTTHGDLTFLDNLKTLMPRWSAPVSFALYAPGTDFNKTLESIQYVRNCLKESDLIQYYVTFHIYFPKEHMPKIVPLTETDALNWPYDCNLPPPYENINRTTMYKQSHNLSYPINVGRNIARKASLTHFILASDIELYPNPGFVDSFLEMVVRNSSVLSGDKPRVFPLATFEIDKRAIMPETKTQLQELLRNKTAIPFHKKVCSTCHNIPNMTDWMSASETDQLNVFIVGQRRSKQVIWEPFYVSDNYEPFFDERVTWEGQKNKRIQGYAMCLLDYEYHVLNNAFLIHSPGIKVFKRDLVREKHVAVMNALIRKEIIPQYKILYGNRKGCNP
ncbi:beta-1,4-glucuronyltransferase 1-like [Episyrphus balteatus]|uniref:beta-1,4-glucuronyltransferase 1-like n=1 Tax=Episyrphus balteatus TaxID=286459 RepID=UPI0024858925|nr:beta-1,4-glucuronyltransferase 1-like [Episyrphus balteatus]